MEENKEERGEYSGRRTNDKLQKFRRLLRITKSSSTELYNGTHDDI